MHSPRRNVVWRRKLLHQFADKAEVVTAKANGIRAGSFLRRQAAPASFSKKKKFEARILIWPVVCAL